VAGGHDIVTEYRAARSMIGLVPQELTTRSKPSGPPSPLAGGCSANRRTPPTSRKCSKTCPCGTRRTARS
jgi:hypothetical protein